MKGGTKLNKRIISFIYRLLVIASLSVGIILNIIQTTSVTAILSYYTLQSNIICLVAFVSFVIISGINKRYQDSDIYHLIKGSITIVIAITGIVYTVALMPIGFEMDIIRINTESVSKFLSNFLVHQLSPILVILDYFIFDYKGKYKLYYPVIWLFIPLNYLIYVYTYSSKGGEFFGVGGSRKFAYFFLDYNQIGYKGVAEAIAIMILFILLISYLLIFVDRKLAKPQNQKLKRS